MRVGIGYDVHALGENRKLIIGGVEIPHRLGLVGHSDADVLTHAIMDALLGAVALGDLGKHFPDTDSIYKNISSMILLGKISRILENEGYKIINIDSIVCAQEPKLSPYIQQMRNNIADKLLINLSQVSVKATTTERLGFVGEEKGISAQAVVLIDNS